MPRVWSHPKGQSLNSVHHEPCHLPTYASEVPPLNKRRIKSVCSAHLQLSVGTAMGMLADVNELSLC